MAKGNEEIMGNPTPIGLMGLAFGCVALAPMELGFTDPGTKIWVWVLMSGGILQIYAGIVDLINKNLLGATAFTLYGSLWVITGWQMSTGIAYEPFVKEFIYVVFLLFTVYMTIGFMTVSMNLTLVFIEFIFIFILEIVSGFFLK
jgi:succinate-acetate transporter protein